MPTTIAAAEHRLIEWNRPAEEIPLQEQIDRGGQLNYVQMRPGRWAEAKCACGQSRSGDAREVFDWALEHADPA